MYRQFTQGTSRIALQDAAVPPSRIPLHPFGTFYGNGQRFTFDQESLAAVQAQLATLGNPWPLDWHHATLKVEEGQAERAPAAGFITGVEVVDDFVYGLVEWNPRGAEAVLSGDFSYVSPVLLYDESGRVWGYHSHALTNRPGTAWQRRIGMEAEAQMNDWLKKLLGLPADATDDQLKAALEALSRRARLGEQVMQALELAEPEDTPAVRARILRLAANEGLADELGRLRAQLEAQSAQAQKERVEGLLRWALEHGRIPAQDAERIAFWRKSAEKDFEAARMALEGMPSFVPTELPTPAKPTQQAALEQSELEIAGLLGLSAEEIQKYGGR